MSIAVRAPGWLQELLGLPKAAARSLCRRLASEGHVEIDPDERGASYSLTLKGGALRNASAAPPVHRATAERAIAELLRRVDAINSDDSLLYYVERVLLFGSMLDEANVDEHHQNLRSLTSGRREETEQLLMKLWPTSLGWLAAR